MTAERLPMRKLREVVRLKLQAGWSGRAIARSSGLSPSTIGTYFGRIALAKLSWPLPPELDDDEALTKRLFPQEGHPVANRPEPDFCVIHQELRRKHVTKMLLWQEYRPMPSVAAVIAIVVEVVGAAALIAGYGTRWAALALAAFTFVATFLFHNFWAMPADQVMMQQLMFYKNIAVVGGLLVLAAHGAGAWSVDAKRGA